MAKAKSDAPPFQMVVERGPKLVPANASDAERLDTWRVGSKVNVTFVRDGSRPMERKWFAVLGLVVSQCNVPWKTKEQASEAIKLALGIVHLSKTVSGAWMQYPKSLTELSDPELDGAVQEMMDLVTRLTGIDPETLRKETADVGRDDREQPEVATPADASSGSGSSGAEIGSDTPSPAAASTSASGGPAEDGSDTGATVGDEPSSNLAPVKRMLMEEYVDNLLRDAFSEPKDQQAAKVEKIAGIFLEPQNLGSHPEFVHRCAETVRRIIGKPHERNRARDYLHGLIR